jgi:hypothetical protein
VGVTFLLGGTDFAGLGALVHRLDLPGPVYAGPGTGSVSAITWLPGEDVIRPVEEALVAPHRHCGPGLTHSVPGPNSSW